MNQPPYQGNFQGPPPPHGNFQGPPPPGYGMGQPGYRMPQASPVPEGARPSQGIVSFHLVSAIAPIVGLVVGGGMMAASLGTLDGTEAPGAGFFSGVGLLVLGLFGFMVCSILRMVWFFQIWSWIPPSHRITKSWSSGMTPGFAALGHLIPYFNLYWNFAAVFATCDAMEQLSAQYTPGRQTPRGLGMATAICNLLFFPVAPFLMHSFMKDIGKMAEQIDAERARVSGVPAAY